MIQSLRMKCNVNCSYLNVQCNSLGTFYYFPWKRFNCKCDPCQLLLQAIKSWKRGTVFCAYQVMGIVEINQFLLFLFLCIWFYTSSPYGLSSVGSGKVKILSFFKTIFLRILLHYPVSSVHRMLKDYLYTDWYLYSLLVRFLHDV